MSNKLVKIAEDSARGGFFLFLGNTLSTAILAVGSILVARLLGPGDYGLYALSLVVPALLSQLVSLGLDPALTRFLAKLKAEGKRGLAASFLRSGLTFRLLTGGAASVIGLVFSDTFATYILNRPDMGFFVRLASVVILFQAVFGAVNSSFVGFDRMENSALTKCSQSTVKATLAPLLTVLGFGVVGAVLGHVLSYAAAVVLTSSILFIRQYRSLRASPNDDGHFLRDLKVMVSYGLPLYSSTLLSVFLGQYQFMLLAFYTSNLQIGNFNAALNLTALINILIFPMATALFPAFSKLNPESEGGELRRLFRLSIKYTSLLIVPASLAVATLSKDLVHLIYGSSYEFAPPFLALYVIIFLYAGLGSLVLGSFLNGIGETKLTLKIGLLNAAIFVPSALLLTQLYSVPGLILTLLISNLASLTYGLITAQKTFGASPNLGDSLRVYLASSLSAIPILIFLQLSPFSSLLNVVFGGTLFLLAYLTLTPLLGAVRTPDIENLRTIFSRLKIVWPILKPVLAYEAKLLSTFTSK